MEYRAEIFDQFQLLYEATGFNDHQLHCVLRFASGLDADVLRKAVVASVEAIPILGSRYIDDVQRPRWESIDPSRFGEAFLLARTEGEFNEFVTSRIEESRGPQVRACLLGVSPFALALCMNHMVCDAAGFKEFLYFLCDIYSKLASGFDCRPIMTTGDRGIAEVLRRFSVVAKLKSLILQSAENNRCGARRFPLSEGRDTRPFILTRKLGGERSAALQVYCKARGVTLNDAVLTAYYRCLFRRLAIPPGTELRIPLMVDMRRYLKDRLGFPCAKESNFDGHYEAHLYVRRKVCGHPGKNKNRNGREEKQQHRPQRLCKAQFALSAFTEGSGESQVKGRPEEPSHLHDERGNFGLCPAFLRQRSSLRRIYVRFDKVQASFPARLEFLWGGANLQFQSLRR